MRHLVTEEILIEDVKKSDMYGSISSVLKVKILDVPWFISRLNASFFWSPILVAL